MHDIRSEVRGVTVYMDLLFLLNWGMNCWILWATGILLRRHAKALHLFLAAASGSAFAFIWLLLPLKLFTEIVLKALVATAMVQLCFTPEKVRELIKLTLGFLGLSALCAGITYAMALSGTAKTGEPLPSVAWWLVLGGPIALTLPLQRLWASLLARLSSITNAAQLRLTICGTMFEISATLDTGNTLQEPLTARPVIVVSPDVLLNALTVQSVEQMVAWQSVEQGVAEVSHQQLLDCFSDSPLITKLVFIPYNTVSQSGLMLGIRPDKCEIYSKSGWHEVKAVLGIGRKDVDLMGFRALLPVSMLSIE